MTLATAALASGCWWLHPAEPEEAVATPLPPSQRAEAIEMRALPGGLNLAPMFNSNSPEIVQQQGILLAAWPAVTAADRLVCQPVLPPGDFSIFSHHIAKEPRTSGRLLHLGLLATNPGQRQLVLTIEGGSSYLSQPDAPFKALAPLLVDDNGEVYAGPGDRIATDLLHGRSSLPRLRAILPPGTAYLISSLPIPTYGNSAMPINGRTTLIQAHADGPVGIAEVALFTQRGNYNEPTAQQYLEEMHQARLAGPREMAATPYNPNAPAPPGFRYGRVAGVARGTRWLADLIAHVGELPAPGRRVGFPIATALANKLGTQQIQSAPLFSRYGDTAYAAHGNYGLTYELTLTLQNPTQKPTAYTLGLAQPLRVDGRGPNARAIYVDPPRPQVMFRGPVALTVRGADGRRQSRFVHVVLHNGEAAHPFARIALPPGRTVHASVTLGYPADATPPQLLTVERDP